MVKFLADYVIVKLVSYLVITGGMYVHKMPTLLWRYLVITITGYSRPTAGWFWWSASFRRI
jgi:hypothetical protein